MAECIVLKGGGGADLDVITAGAGDVLAGKVFVDKEGEPVTGKIPVRGSAYHGVGSGLNDQGLYYYIEPGYYSEGSNNPWVYRTRAEVAASLGIEPWKMRGDVNICGVQGGIPIQGADASNNYAWNTTWANWGDGNIFMGVRNGHLLNGVGWIRAYIENFWASNIKKGVNIGGIWGTFEGYVPTATDLYLRGNNIAGWTKGGAGTGSTYTVLFEAGQITFGIMASDGYLTTNSPINLTGYNGIAVEGYRPGPATTLIIQLASSNGPYSQTDGGIARADTATGGYSNFTAYCNVSAINAIKYIHINAINTGIYVYRIWLY